MKATFGLVLLACVVVCGLAADDYVRGTVALPDTTKASFAGMENNFLVGVANSTGLDSTAGFAIASRTETIHADLRLVFTYNPPMGGKTATMAADTYNALTRPEFEVLMSWQGFTGAWLVPGSVTVEPTAAADAGLTPRWLGLITAAILLAGIIHRLKLPKAPKWED